MRIITDSAGDLTKEFLEKNNVELLPLIVVEGDEEFLDDGSLKSEDLIKWSYENKKTPKTSTATNEQVLKVLQKSFDTKEETIFISISSGASSSVNQIRKIVNDNKANDYIKVVDSKNLAMGQALIVKKIVDDRDSGKNFEEIFKNLNETVEKVKSRFVVNNLDFLKFGGRCSSLTATIGGILKFKPLIEMVDGKLEMIKKLRGSAKNVAEKLIDDTFTSFENIDKEYIYVSHTYPEDKDIDFFVEKIKNLNYFENVVVNKAGPIVTSHAGDYTIGIAYIEN